MLGGVGFTISRKRGGVKRREEPEVTEVTDV